MLSLPHANSDHLNVFSFIRFCSHEKFYFFYYFNQPQRHQRPVKHFLQRFFELANNTIMFCLALNLPTASSRYMLEFGVLDVIYSACIGFKKQNELSEPIIPSCLDPKNYNNYFPTRHAPRDKFKKTWIGRIATINTYS